VALADAMLRLARDPERIRQMGLAGRAICEEKFELGAVTAATVALMDGSSKAPGQAAAA
jgi:glycosyltransferase involved in cell wall biosynthesis